jgi:hypothetical protein
LNSAVIIATFQFDEDVNNLPKMEKRNSDIATDEPFSQEEIKKLLIGLNTTKSPGAKGLHKIHVYCI